jgi:hypothetical protein
MSVLATALAGYRKPRYVSTIRMNLLNTQLTKVNIK